MLHLLAFLATHAIIFLVSLVVIGLPLVWVTQATEKKEDDAHIFLRNLNRNAWGLAGLVWLIFIGVVTVSVVLDRETQRQVEAGYAEDNAREQRYVDDLNRKTREKTAEELRKVAVDDERAAQESRESAMTQGSKRWEREQAERP